MSLAQQNLASPETESTGPYGTFVTALVWHKSPAPVQNQVGSQSYLQSQAVFVAKGKADDGVECMTLDMWREVHLRSEKTVGKQKEFAF